MKIQGLSKVVSITKEGLKIPGNRATGIKGNDKLSVSDLGRVSQQIATVVKQTPDIRIDKVNFFKQAIQNKRYEINAGGIAAKIMDISK